MPNEIKFCKDCHYYKPDATVKASEALCSHPDFLSLVDGSVMMPCVMARDVKPYCGRLASKFGAKKSNQ